MKKYLLAFAVLAVVIFASGCIDTGDTGNNTTSSNQSTTVIPETDNLILTISDSNSSYETYSSGDEIDITFSTSDKTFTLSDKWGSYNGTYTVSGDVISLQFSDSVWVITLNSDGTFTGSEGDARDAGTYKWV